MISPLPRMVRLIRLYRRSHLEAKVPGYFVMGAVCAFAAAVQPGSFQAYLISESLAHGWRRTILASCAPLISDGPIILLVLLILSTVPPWLLLALQCAGGVFLLYLAYGAHRTWRTYATRREPATEGGQRSVLKAALGISLEDMDRSLGDCAGMFRGLPVLGGGACAPLGRASQRAPAH